MNPLMQKSLRHICLLIVIFFALSVEISPVYAQSDSAASPSYTAPAPSQDPAGGLAMHGAPKYGADFTHLDYADPNAPKGGTLRRAALGTFDSLNPYAIKGKAAQGLNLFYDRLMQRVWDEPFTMYPLIADKVTVAPDRSAVTFHINPKARFHDGTPITADDVLFSYETLKEQGRPNMRSVYRLVTKAEKIDERTVHFEFGDGYNQETVMILAMMPVLSKAWWQGRTFDASTLDIPNSNGPYRIKSVEPGRRIVYERDPNYWAKDLPVNKGQYNFDEISYDYYRDDTVAFEAFKAGDLDIRMEGDIGKWVTGYDDLPAVKDGDIVKEALPHKRPEKVRALIFNTRRPPFNDIRVRQALEYVLDFDWINKNLFHGQYQRIESYFPNSSLAATGKPSEAELKLLEPFREDLPESVFGPAWKAPEAAPQQQQRMNLRKADTLLKEAGLTVKNGKRINPQTGQPFSFEILLGAPEDEKIALAFKRGLARLGIDTTIRVMDVAAYRGSLNDYDFDMTLYYWQNSLSPGTEQMLYWSCESAKAPARWNFAGICNPAVDALAAGIAEAKSREDLVTETHALDRVLMHGDYIIPLYYSGKDYIAHSKDVTHTDVKPLYGAVIESWWDKKSAKKESAE